LQFCILLHRISCNNYAGNKTTMGCYKENHIYIVEPRHNKEINNMKADAHTAGEIEAVIKALTVAYKTRNLNDLMACFAPDSDVVLYGTGVDEKRIGPEQIRFQIERDWAQTDSIEMSFNWSSISAANNIAWAAMDGVFNIRAQGQGMTVPARASFVLEKRAGKWLIVHSHFSTPAAGQEEGSSF